ncbi:transposase [Staphylococcus equorum]
MRRKKRSFSNEFKRKMVTLYRSGSSQKEIREEYDLSPSVLARWIKEAQYEISDNQINKSSIENSTKQKDALPDISLNAIEEMENDLKNAYSRAEELQEQLQKEKEKIGNIEITLKTLTSYLK